MSVYRNICSRTKLTVVTMISQQLTKETYGIFCVIHSWSMYLAHQPIILSHTIPCDAISLIFKLLRVVVTIL